MNPPSNRRGDWLPRLGAAGVLVLVAGLAFWFWPSDDGPTTVRTIQAITVVTPPPPPPPPEPEEKIMEEEPEIVEPTTEPEIQKDVASADEPSEAPASSEAAGLDRPADAGSDSFRLAAGKGGGLFGKGGGGGGGWGPFVETHIRRALQRDPRTRSADGYLKVAITIDDNGRIAGARLLSSTGDARLDAAVREVLRTLPPLGRGRPPSAPADTVATINMKRLAG